MALSRLSFSLGRCCYKTSSRLCATEAAHRKRQNVRAAIEKIDQSALNALAETSFVPTRTTPRAPFEDTFGRNHTYLRISLTERCNLRCLYCMPEEGVKLTPSTHLLTSDEIVRLVQIFARNGVDKIRLTGGEPTIRSDLPDLIARINAVPGINSIGITSNGIVLHRHLETLKNAGLTKVNISLDTLDAEKFLMMTRRNGFNAVMKTIKKAEALFPMVKINNVVMKNVNDGEMCDFVELTKHRRLDVRFIEYMPFGGNHFSTKKFVEYRTMLASIKDHYNGHVERLQDGPNDTTKAYKVSGYAGQFGFITSMSEHFCDTCNRLRITADGNLKVCLHGNKEVSMRDLLRSGASEDEVTRVIQQAVLRKKRQHAGFRNGKSTAHGKSPNDPDWRINNNAPMSSLLISTVPISLINQNLSRTCSLQRRLFSSQYPTTPNLLTHIDNQGSAKQVDVSHKTPSERVAVAEGHIQLTSQIVEQIRSNVNKKGDVLTVARVASIMAAKQTSSLIPLCHNIPISSLDTQLTIDEASNTLHIRCTAKTTSNTGIEMEALTACSVAALTVYDMCKAISSQMVIGGIRLVSKTGGKTNFHV